MGLNLGLATHKPCNTGKPDLLCELGFFVYKMVDNDTPCYKVVLQLEVVCGWDLMAIEKMVTNSIGFTVIIVNTFIITWS